MREWHPLLNGWKKWITRLRPREVKWGDTILAWTSTGTQKVSDPEPLTFHSTSSVFFSNSMAKVSCKFQRPLQLKCNVTANFSSTLGENLSSFPVPLVLSIMATWGRQMWLTNCLEEQGLLVSEDPSRVFLRPLKFMHMSVCEWVCLLSSENVSSFSSPSFRVHWSLNE